MQFERHFRFEPRERTPGRVAAAKRAIKKETERCGLFPELMRFRTVDERFAQMDERSRAAIASWRAYDAKIWKKGRSLYRALDTKRRDEVMRVWRDPARHRRRGPMEFYYLVKQVMEPGYFSAYQPNEDELRARRARGAAFSAYLIKRAAALHLFLGMAGDHFSVPIERAYVDGSGELNIIPVDAAGVQRLNAGAQQLLALFAATMDKEDVEGYTARTLRAWKPK